MKKRECIGYTHLKLLTTYKQWLKEIAYMSQFQMISSDLSALTYTSDRRLFPDPEESSASQEHLPWCLPAPREATCSARWTAKATLSLRYQIRYLEYPTHLIHLLKYWELTNKFLTINKYVWFQMYTTTRLIRQIDKSTSREKTGLNSPILQVPPLLWICLCSADRMEESECMYM